MLNIAEETSIYIVFYVDYEHIQIIDHTSRYGIYPTDCNLRNSRAEKGVDGWIGGYINVQVDGQMNREKEK